LRNKKLILIGAGGHARIAIDIANLNNFKILGIIDLNYKQKKKTEYINSYPVIGGLEKLKNFETKNIKAFISIGDNITRKKYYKILLNRNFSVINLIHPSAIISKSVSLGSGVMVGPGAIINANSMIKDNVIINSGSIIEHEVTVFSHSHCAPRSIVAGRSIIGETVVVGAGSIIIENLEIGKNSIIAAGSTVIKKVANNLLIAGTPGKIKKNL